MAERLRSYAYAEVLNMAKKNASQTVSSGGDSPYGQERLRTRRLRGRTDGRKRGSMNLYAVIEA